MPRSSAFSRRAARISIARTAENPPRLGCAELTEEAFEKLRAAAQMSEHRVAVRRVISRRAEAIAVDIGERRDRDLPLPKDDSFALDETCPHRGAPLHQGASVAES